MVFANPIYSVETFFLKDGYELKKVFCDSYSISDSALLSLAAAVVLAGDSDSSESLSLTDIALDEGNIHDKSKELLSVRAQYHLPSGIKEIRENGIKLWNNCVRKVEMNGSKYHPKLILACFRKKDDEREWFYRLQVGSANLTAMSGFETAVIVEGAAAANGNANGAVLKEFYEKVFNQSIPAELEALNTVEFVSPDPPKGYVERSHISNIRFAYTFPKGASENCFKEVLAKEVPAYETENCPELHVYSPFMKFDGNGRQYLSDKLKNINISYYTNLTQEIFDSNITESLYCATKDKSLFLHAKVYVIKGTDNNNFSIWQGSANASESGFEKNVEFMIGADMSLDYDKNSNFSDMTSFIYKEDNVAFGNDPEVKFTELSKINNPDQAFTDTESTFIVNTVADAFKVEAKVQDKDKIHLSVNVDYTKLDNKIVSVELFDRKDNVIYSYERIPNEGGHKLYTFLDKDCFCYGGQMVARVKLQAIDEPLITLIKVDGEAAPDTKPVSLMGLVDEWKCRDAIPKCKEKGFSSVYDDVYRRLRAYIASYGVEKKTECYQKCLERINKLERSLNGDEKRYMSEDEQKTLVRLKEFLGKAGVTGEQ